MVRRYVPTVAAIVLMAVCITAGNWQRARLHLKQSLQAQFEAATAAAPLTNVDVARAAGNLAPSRYRAVQLQGTFDATRQFFLDNKVQAGQVGYDVVAPFRLAEDGVVLVDRGWVPQGPSRSILPSVPAPQGMVTLRGRIDVPSSYFELEPDAPAHESNVRQHLGIARFAAESGLPLLPVLVQQTAPATDGDRLTRAWPAPDFGIDTHRIYMVQWYAFAAVAFVFWVVTHWPRAWPVWAKKRETGRG